MSAVATRPSFAWILAAHTLAAQALGALEAVRLGSAVGRSVVPLFALTGLAIGAAIAACERLAAGKRWWLAALVLALPSLVVTIPVAANLFDGAYAQTLPLAGVLPWLAPIVAVGLIAGLIAVGRRLTGDLMGRAIAVLIVAGLFGAVTWTKRHVLGSGYPGAHVGGTLAGLVLAGVMLRLVWRGRFSTALASAIGGLALGTGIASIAYGLRSPAERVAVSVYGDQARDLVQLYRTLIDLDRDGSSPILGGGDCDDRDASIHPGARDIPGDGIDQDCDGRDATPPQPQAAPPRADAWLKSPEVAALLARTRGMSVLLVTVDALRLDLLAPGAPARDDYPRLAKLYDQAVSFDRAIAPAASTDVSLCTLLTGRFDPYQPVATTLPEALRHLGRRTYSALPAEVTRYVGDVLLGRGIEHPAVIQTDWAQADVGDHVSAAATTQTGIRALDDAAGKPSFVWLHYFDVHEHHQIKVGPEALARVHDATPGTAARPYRALLAEIDREVGRVLDELDRRRLTDSTIVVFASDHGESLGDDPRLGDTHGRVAYAPLVRIPLAIRIPGVAAGRRTDPVSLVDLAPTVLQLLDAGDAIRPLDGTPLLPVLLAAPAALRPPADRAIAIHEEWQWSVVEWPYQLLVKPGDNVVELYDLARDPAEKTDLAQAQPAVVSRLRARFAEAPDVRVDRTPAGRAWREQQAQPPPRHAMP